MPNSDPVYCQRCDRPTVRIVYVVADGQADAGPYGRRCARLVVADFAHAGVAATRRYGRA